MKTLLKKMTAPAFVGLLLLTACANDNNTTGAGDEGSLKDTNLVDTRRNSGDTSSFLTPDSSKANQDLIDPNTPGGKR
jgi:hypothetical protein